MLPPRIGIVSRDGRVEACGVSRGALQCSMRIRHKGLRALHERDNPARSACGTGAMASAHLCSGCKRRRIREAPTRRASGRIP